MFAYDAQEFSKIAKNFLSPYLSAFASGDGPRCYPLLDATVAGAAAGSAAFLTAPLNKVKLRYAFTALLASMM